MELTRYFLVAGHIFSLSLPDGDPLWKMLERQYGPFEVSGDGCSAEKLLFSLKLTENIAETERKCVYDSPTEKGETAIRLFSRKDGWLFEIMKDSGSPVCASILSDGDFRNAGLKLECSSPFDSLFCINNAAMLMFAFASAPLGTLAFHASVIENDGQAYLFLGKSGTGKSTHSSLWLKHIAGSTLMNDDNPAVRLWPDGRIVAYGSPWSGKTPCYKNVSAPVGAFVQIRQAPKNAIQRMSVLDAYASLLSSISGLKTGSGRMADDLNDSVAGLLESSPCWILDCLPDREAAELCFNTITTRH